MSKFKREFLWWLGCFVAAEGVNLYAILLYHRPAVELVLMIGFVLAISLVFYALCALGRLLVHLMSKIAKHR